MKASSLILKEIANDELAKREDEYIAYLDMHIGNVYEALKCLHTLDIDFIEQNTMSYVLYVKTTINQNMKLKSLDLTGNIGIPLAEKKNITMMKNIKKQFYTILKIINTTGTTG